MNMCIIKTVGGDVNTRCCQEKEKKQRKSRILYKTISLCWYRGLKRKKLKILNNKVSILMIIRENLRT